MAQDRFVVTNLAINPATHRGNLDGRTKTRRYPSCSRSEGRTGHGREKGPKPRNKRQASKGALFAGTLTAQNTALTLHKHHISGSFDPHGGQKRGGQTTMYDPGYGCTPCR